MKFLGKCIWHRWKYEKRAGGVDIRICKDCNVMQREFWGFDSYQWCTITGYPTTEEILDKIRGKGIPELAELIYWKKLDEDHLPKLIQIRINRFWDSNEGVELKQKLENKILSEKYSIVVNDSVGFYDNLLKSMEGVDEKR